MGRVEKAIQEGRCSVAVSGSLLRDAEVMLALTRRKGLRPMALAGPAVSPVLPVSEAGIARAVASPGGVVVLIEPESSDSSGLDELGKLLARGKNKPDVIVVARKFNPFAFAGPLAKLKLWHEKGRGKTFITNLPEIDEASLPALETKTAVKPKSKKGNDIPAPKFHFTGRDDELVVMAEFLKTGGPIVVSGPQGVGRSWLTEHALAASELKRAPNVNLSFGVGFDTLIGQLATIAKEAGNDGLVVALRATDRTPTSLVAKAIEVLKDEALAGHVLLVDNLGFGLGRDTDFFRKSRLEILLEALLTNEYALKIVFISSRQPMTIREGEGKLVRRLPLGGIKGRFFHEIFESYKAGEVPRDKFGPFSDRCFGHVMAVRTAAIDVRIRKEGAAILDDAKYFKMENLHDTQALRKRVGRRLEKVDKSNRAALSTLSHARLPLSGQEISNLGINRKTRLELLSLGLLDMIGTAESRFYRVHPIVRRLLTFREISDFDINIRFSEMYERTAKDADVVLQAALLREKNRTSVAARRTRYLSAMPFSLSDNDPLVESCIGMLRSRAPRLELIAQRTNEIIKNDPSNSDAWLVKIALTEKDCKPEAMLELLDLAAKTAAVPELYHRVCGWMMSRRKRNLAVTVLEKAIETFPEEPRFRTRLAAIFLRLGRRTLAIENLRKAMELAPMLPDPYGLLGQARREEGDITEAENLLREAVRLAPNDAVQVSRLVSLLMAKARIASGDERRVLVEESKTLLDDVLKENSNAAEIQLLLATLIREDGQGIERADWLLKKVRKHTDRHLDRFRRLQVQEALVLMAAGQLDEAERRIRQRVSNDPTDHAAFAALGHILEAREQFVPAHAEYQRAKERTAQNNLECTYYNNQLVRMQAVIEAQAAGLWTSSNAESIEETPAADVATGNTAHRVIRRKAHPDAANTSVEASAEGAPVEQTTTSDEQREPTPPVVEASPEAPSDSAPVESAPAESAPAESAPAESAPVESTPEAQGPETKNQE